MAVNVKPSEVYACTDLRSGDSQRGAWAFFKVKAQKGYDTINIWATNPDAIKGAQAAKVIRIDNVELKARLNEKNGQWYKDFNVTCTLERASADAVTVKEGKSGRPAKSDDDFLTIPDDNEINKLFGL